MSNPKKDEDAEYFDLRPYTHKEMRTLYGVSWNTWKLWVAPFKEQIGELLGRTYTVKQVRTIIDKLGFPSKLKL